MEQPRIPDELFQAVRDKGHVRVLVKIARDEAAGESIADAQTAVLASLAGLGGLSLSLATYLRGREAPLLQPKDQSLYAKG